MKISILSVGRIKEQYTLDWEMELVKRISPYARIEFIEIKEEPITANKNLEIVKEREAENIISKIPTNFFTIALDMKGEDFSSENFANKIQKLQNQTNHISFIIGGPAGLHEKVLNSVNMKLSFSKFTFTHQIMRILLLEQIYRAFCINNHRPYHL